MQPFPDLVDEKQSDPVEPTKNDIIDSKEFHVGVVRIPKGQEIPPHPEPYAVFFYVLQGAGEFTGREGTVELTEGDALYLEHGEQRGIRCIESLTILGIQEAH